MATSTYDHLDEGTLELRVRMWRPAIEYCFKKSDVVTKLAQHGLLNAEETTRLIEIYDQKPSQDAASDLFQILFKKCIPRKWKTFVDALTETGYDFVVSRLIDEEVEIADERERGKQLLLLFGPFLERDIDPKLLIPRLVDSKVIKDEDADKIENTTHTKSKAEGIRILLQRIQSYMKPHQWWEAFLIVLWETEFEHVALLLEPDFHPSSKKLGPIIDESEGAAGHDDVQEHVIKGTSSNKSPDQDIDKEHIMTDQVDAESDNDLNAPPVPARTHSLVACEDDARLYTRQTTGAMASNVDNVKALNDNFKELNIKPERMKSVDDVAHDSDVDSVESNQWDSDNGGSDIDEDDENQVVPKRKYELRDYQLELAEKALEGRNTIICAETGTGKTWVALYVIDKHLSQASKGTGKVAFMARTGVLIKQQSNRFKKFLPDYRTKLITGDDEDSRMVDAFIPTNDIMCFTPQILVNNLESGNVSSLSEFSLLVFDECHHTRGDEPYAQLARKYLQEKNKTNVQLPQIVGLTASIGVGRSRSVEDAVEYILRICAILDVRPPLSTVERTRQNYMKFVNTPNEETIKMVVKNPDPCKKVLIQTMEETEEIMQGMTLFQSSLVELFEEKRPQERDSQAYNNWTVDMMKAAQQKVSDAEIARDITACAVYLNVYNSALEVNNLLRILDVVKYLAMKHEGEFKGKHKHTETERRLFDSLCAVQSKLANLCKDKDAENPNVHTISKQLQDMLLEKGDDSRAVVFVKARATCRALAAFLDKELKQFGVRARPLFGKQTKGADEGMTESVQTETVEKFREGHYKVMVCTSVGTEGIDVPDCNIVINYNYSGDEITKIQMKGRSRKKGATHVLVGDDKLIEQEMVNAYKVDLMRKAMSEIKLLNPTNIQYKIKMFQENEKQKFLLKEECTQAKKSRTEDDDLEIRCKHCNEFGCFVSDLRKLDCHHFVVDNAFKDKVTRKPDNPKKFDGLEIKVIMDCPKCTNMWGHVGQREGTELYLLKLAQFKFVKTANGETKIYKKWSDVPYKIPELKPGDISKLYGN